VKIKKQVVSLSVGMQVKLTKVDIQLQLEQRLVDTVKVLILLLSDTKQEISDKNLDV